jgi:hypothetical protein
MKRVSHVGDDRLVTACVGGPSPAEEAHFAVCEACAARRRTLERLLDEVAAAADAQTHAAFPEERLAAQRSKILDRIAHAGQPGQVIAFPTSAGAPTRPFRTRPSSRWVAAAAAAGLAVGLLVGLSFPGARRGAQPPSLTASTRVDGAQGVFLPAAIRLSEDDFLGQVEIAVSGPVEVLRTLHELTPTAADQFEE